MRLRGWKLADGCDGIVWDQELLAVRGDELKRSWENVNHRRHYAMGVTSTEVELKTCTHGNSWFIVHG